MFDIFHILWTNKALLVRWTIVGFIFGVIASFVIPQTYRLEISFTSNYHSIMAEQMCSGSRNLQQCKQNTDFANNPDFADFSIKSNKIILRDKNKTVTLPKAEQLVVALKGLIGPKSKQIFDESTQTMAYIRSLRDELNATGFAVREMLKQHHKISQYNNGTAFADIGEVEYVSKRPGPIPLVLIFGIVGLFLSTIFVLVRDSYLNWQRDRASGC